MWWGQSKSHALPAYQPQPVANDMPAEELGEILFETKGCITCHTIDGSARVGPTFLHAYGVRITLESGETIVIDEVYLRESIDFPRAKSRPGYPPAMPAEYRTLLSEREKAGLVAFIKTLR
jgi:cytochrome c oxidase subunit 2